MGFPRQTWNMLRVVEDFCTENPVSPLTRAFSFNYRNSGVVTVVESI